MTPEELLAAVNNAGVTPEQLTAMIRGLAPFLAIRQLETQIQIKRDETIAFSQQKAAEISTLEQQLAAAQEALKQAQGS